MAVAEANAFALASHIYWGVWAILQVRLLPPCVPCIPEKGSCSLCDQAGELMVAAFAAELVLVCRPDTR